MKDRPVELTEAEQAIYQWQMWSPQIGESGQRRLKAASVLVSRCGGVGGAAAYYLAAAGVGRLVLAHAGKLKPGDLNRQILMTHDWIGRERVESARRRLRELNPRVEVVAIPENVSATNADRLVSMVDLVVDAAPLFVERYAMNRAAVVQNKPMVECAMYDLEAQVTTIRPGQTPCLSCLYPESPPGWKRQFPVFGAVAGLTGALGAVEAIKLITGRGKPLLGRMLLANLEDMSFRTVRMRRDEQCPVCREVAAGK